MYLCSIVFILFTFTKRRLGFRISLPSGFFFHWEGTFLKKFAVEFEGFRRFSKVFEAISPRDYHMQPLLEKQALL